MAAEETFRRENIDGSAETKWYVAELVLQFRVANEARSILHINTKLINAVSANQAYEKATTLGRSEEADYTNTDGNTVACRFVDCGSCSLSWMTSAMGRSCSMRSGTLRTTLSYVRF